jgi:hypothetical protein
MQSHILLGERTNGIWRNRHRWRWLRTGGGLTTTLVCGCPSTGIGGLYDCGKVRMVTGERFDTLPHTYTHPHRQVTDKSLPRQRLAFLSGGGKRTRES